MKGHAVCPVGYLNEAEEQIELLPWFDLKTGAESSLREKKKTQHLIKTRHEETSVSKWYLHLSLNQLLKHYKKITILKWVSLQYL